MGKGGNVVPSVTAAEHIGPDDTGDNIEAKRTAGYVWEPTTSTWQRQMRGMFNKPYDELLITYTDDTKEDISSIVSKLAGTTQQTITLTNPSSNQDRFVVS